MPIGAARAVITTAPASGVPSCPAGLLTSLGMYWKLDESAGTAVSDASGNGRGGTTTSSPPFAAGKLNNGIDLDGTADFITADSAWFDPDAGAFSIAAWVKADTVGATGSERVIAHQLDGTGIGRTLLSSSSSTPTKLNTFIGGTALQGSTTLTTGTWYHVCLTVSAGGSVNLYLDGSLNGGPATRTVESATGALLVGKHKNGTSFWDGIIDDFRVYSRELSASDVSDLYNAGTGCAS